jgi:glycine dehydrogenase
MNTYLSDNERFSQRHIGPDALDQEKMLKVLGVPTLDALIEQIVPASIRLKAPLEIGEADSEVEFLDKLGETASKNELLTTCIGMGYYDCVTPPVILRNVFENPGWYTQYTPYQAEIAQGRLESLFNFQSMIVDMTGFEIANASLLDEATAAAEAMHLMHALHIK